jgi:TPR repeat protein
MAGYGRVFWAACVATATLFVVAGPDGAARAFDGASTSAASAVKPLEIFKNPQQALQSGLASYQAGNPASCVAALTYAAAGGESLAQWKLGRMYADGDGVTRDEYKAYEYFSEIVDRYDEDNASWRDQSVAASAFVAVGLFDLKGITGALPADAEEAQRLFRFAATHFSDANAQYQLARLYLDGAPGVPKSRMQAARWLHLAAEKNHVESQALLGQMLFSGEGIPAQRARGLMWMTLAREGAVGKSQDWIRALYEKAMGAASDTDRQAALVYLEDHLKRND